MSSVVIVAIPSDGDPVWRYSSEKIPHMTMLFLGEMEDGPEFARIETYLQHLADTSFASFGLSVDHRGTLGPDKADVLFFDKSSQLDEPIAARQAMLANRDIRVAYETADQYPEWTPHLTMGYPITPAKPDDREYPGFNWVNFDRIALWFGDSTGPEFKLREDNVLTMTDYASDVLSHHGVKGMKWGVRKDQAVGSVKAEVAARTSSEVTVVAKPGQLVRTKGGVKNEASADAIRARTSQQIAKKSTLDALSNKELQDLVTRMNLEQQYNQLAYKEADSRVSNGEKYARKALDDYGDAGLTALASTPAAPAVPALKLALTGYKLKRESDLNKLANAPGVQKNKKKGGGD